MPGTGEFGVREAGVGAAEFLDDAAIQPPGEVDGLKRGRRRRR
jgi:hypothetical protein